MVLENKLGITNSAQLADMEEKLTKKKAAQLFETGELFKFGEARPGAGRAERSG